MTLSNQGVEDKITGWQHKTHNWMLRKFKAPCLKGICDEIVDVEEIGYRNGVMHVRCLKCGWEQHGEGIIPHEIKNYQMVENL